MRFRGLAIAVVVLGSTAALPAPGTAADVQQCQLITIHNRLSALATVLSTRGTTCARARRLIRRKGNFLAPVDVGDRFKIKDFNCKVYFSVEESHRARCTTENKAFRVDYGA